MLDSAKNVLDSTLDSAKNERDSAKFDKSEFDILVAKCGKTIGLKGEVKLIIYSDFLEVFTKGNVFLCRGAESSLDSANSKHEANSSIVDEFLGFCEARDADGTLSPSRKRGLQKRERSPQDDEFALDSAFFLTLKSFNSHKNSATFAEITNINSAKNLTSMLLFSSKSLTKKQCVLGEGEHFWFDIINKNVVEKGEVLGVVIEIERIGSVDYLIVNVEDKIFAKYPHIKVKRFYLPYISRYILGAENGVIAVQDALLILENS